MPMIVPSRYKIPNENSKSNGVAKNKIRQVHEVGHRNIETYAYSDVSAYM
jgi:hypothetical protein